MAVVARINWLRNQIWSGAHVSAHYSRNPARPSRTCLSFTLGKLGTGPIDFVALALLDGIDLCLPSHSVWDRGHRHTAGYSVITIYLEASPASPGDGAPPALAAGPLARPPSVERRRATTPPLRPSPRLARDAVALPPAHCPAGHELARAPAEPGAFECDVCREDISGPFFYCAGCDFAQCGPCSLTALKSSEPSDPAAAPLQPQPADEQPAAPARGAPASSSSSWEVLPNCRDQFIMAEPSSASHRLRPLLPGQTLRGDLVPRTVAAAAPHSCLWVDSANWIRLLDEPGFAAVGGTSPFSGDPVFWLRRLGSSG